MLRETQMVLRWRPSSARGVLVRCSCNRWGYAGPDESKALDAFRTHVEEETRTRPGEQAGEQAGGADESR